VSTVVAISGLAKTYASGLQALQPLDLDIRAGEIFALLGPNGAGKTTLISLVCGLVKPTAGRVSVAGHDVQRDYRAARALVGLVPQELFTEMFETVAATVAFSRGLFGLPPDPAHIERVLRELALWDKRHAPVMALSGGMKRRVLIAKALAHAPRVLFLDEPTAGVDVELRRDMWALVRRLRAEGVTVVLTTHYLEEAEELAERIGVIREGQLILVQDKSALMRRFGRKQLSLTLAHPLEELPVALASMGLTLGAGGACLELSFEPADERELLPEVLKRVGELGLVYTALDTRQSTLEDIFVRLVREPLAGPSSSTPASTIAPAGAGDAAAERRP
jgi:ABC-2 type transport system ATP-binding protein